MCRSQVEGGRRCNKHTPYGMRMRALQAKKQYHTHLQNDPSLTPAKRARHTQHLQATITAMTVLHAEKTALGTVQAHTMALTPTATRVLDALHAAGYEPYIVGGSVRDSLMDLHPKDVDIEVYGGDADNIARVLRTLGRVDEVGKSFGVLKLQIDGEDFDVSLPRRDSKVGGHHRDFEVEVNPELSLDEATARRDYTINALMYSHRLGFVIDRHNGLRDMADGYLRHVSDAFDEDPLRVLRGVQMASRFNMRLHPDTLAKAIGLRDQYTSLARERIQIEFQKLYLKGKTLTPAIDALRATGWQQLFPGLVATDNPQRAAILARVDGMLTAGQIPTGSREKLLAATLATGMDDAQRDQFLGYTTVSHDVAGAASALTSIPHPAATDASLRHWARDLHRNVSAEEWLLYHQILGEDALTSQTQHRLAALNILAGPERDMLNGNDMLALFPGRKAGPWLRRMLDEARDAQYQRAFDTRVTGLAWLASQVRNADPA